MFSHSEYALKKKRYTQISVKVTNFKARNENS